jgi:hypothetical protein
MSAFLLKTYVFLFLLYFNIFVGLFMYYSQYTKFHGFFYCFFGLLDRVENKTFFNQVSLNFESSLNQL